jgi:hypothetical protein
MRGGVCGIYYAHVRGCDPSQQGLDQGIMSASEHEYVRAVLTVAERILQVNTRHLLGDRMLNPSFLD